MASLVSAFAGMRAISVAPGFGRPSGPMPPSTMAMSPSVVTRPTRAIGMPQRSHTSRTAGKFSGRQVASIRSWDSEIITSQGAMPGSRRGIASRSSRMPVPALSADSEWRSRCRRRRGPGCPRPGGGRSTPGWPRSAASRRTGRRPGPPAACSGPGPAKVAEARTPPADAVAAGR